MILGLFHVVGPQSKTREGPLMRGFWQHQQQTRADRHHRRGTPPRFPENGQSQKVQRKEAPQDHGREEQTDPEGRETARASASWPGTLKDMSERRRSTD
ncbi:hypothetical protein KM043_008557 [Ampulex compressa]|nr:hypothetical protein KM043_008557 [Ampulex compressa]